MIGGPYTEQAATGLDSSVIPMPDEQAADPIGDMGNYTPNFGLPRIMSQDGLPEDYLGKAFSAPIEAGADPMQQAPEQGMPKADIQQPTPVADIESEQPQQPQQRGGFQASATAPRFNQRYRYTQEDFYGQPKNIAWTDPRGVQMYVPEAGRLPMAIWASRMQQVQGEREQNRVNMTKFMSELGKGIKTADPYQQSLNEATAAARNRFVGDLAAQYGGNDALAWKEIAEDPQTQQRFIDMHRKFEAIGQHGMQSWERARGYLDALQKGGVHVDVETKRLAEEVYYGLGSMRGDEDIADIDKLVSNINKFEHSVSRDEYAKQWLLPNLEKRYRQYATDVQTRRQNGTGILEWDQVFDGKAFIDEAARSMTDAIAGTTYEENKQWMERNFPAENIKKQVKTYALPKPSKNKGGADGASPAAASGWGYQPPQITTAGVPYSPDATFEFVSAPLEKVGDRMVPPAAIKLNKKGSPEGATVIITGFQKDGSGEWMVLGEEITEKKVSEFNTWRRKLGDDGVTLAKIETNPALTAEYKTWKESTTSTSGAPYEQKLSSNTAQIQGKFGSDDPYVLGGVTTAIAQYNRANKTNYTTTDFSKMSRQDQEAIMSGQPIQKPAQSQQPKATEPAEADIKKAFPGAIKDPKHGWVAKDPATGKWRKVTL